MKGVLASSHAVLAAGAAPTTSTNFTAIFIAVGIPLVIFGAVAIVLRAWFNLQGKRTEVAALTHYRQLAEDVAASQHELQRELARLTSKVETVEKLMRDVG
jgi:hypothetical protein